MTSRAMGSGLFPDKPAQDRSARCSVSRRRVVVPGPAWRGPWPTREIHRGFPSAIALAPRGDGRASLEFRRFKPMPRWHEFMFYRDSAHVGRFGQQVGQMCRIRSNVGRNASKLAEFAFRCGRPRAKFGRDRSNYGQPWLVPGRAEICHRTPTWGQHWLFSGQHRPILVQSRLNSRDIGPNLAAFGPGCWV